MSRRAERSLAIAPLHARGFSLVELMVVLVIGLILTAAIGRVFVNSSRTYKQDEGQVKMRDELRFAVASLTNDIEMAGFWADMLNPASAIEDPTLNAPGCHPTVPRWVYSNRNAFAGVDNASGATAAAAFPCITAAEFQANTDIISIKRLAGAPTAAGTPGVGPFLRSNGTVGALFVGTADAAIVTPILGAVVQNWAYTPAIYYIRNYSVTPGDGIPNLCRKVLQGATPTFTTECLAEGIEDLQVDYGIDINRDGSADIFRSQPSNAQFRLVVSVRLALLGRSANRVPGYQNEKTYLIGNAPNRVPNDALVRRAFSTTVYIRNPTALRRLLGQ